jgi:O-antigen ligase
VLSILSIELLVREPSRVNAAMQHPAAPVLLLTGLSWSMLQFYDAVRWLARYWKLLLIPVLMASSFSLKEVLYIAMAFLISCSGVLLVSYLSMFWVGGPGFGSFARGIPVKDNAVQSEFFALCTFGSLIAAQWLWMNGRHLGAVAAALLATLFFAKICLILISRTGVLVAMSLLGLFLLRLIGWRRASMIGLPLVLISAAALWSTTALKERFAKILVGASAQSAKVASTNISSRVDFWTKAIKFVRSAPLIGHGAGSIQPLFELLEATSPSPYGKATTDPHNQFLHVVLQIGLVGRAVLIAMWSSHLNLFLNDSIVGTFGLAGVWLSILGSQLTVISPRSLKECCTA